MTVSVDRMTAALKYLADTDEDCAELRADHARSKFRADSIHNAIFMSYDKGSVADRKARAETEPRYRDAKSAEFDAFLAYEAMKNKRITETIVIDTWRSLNSARNKGQII